VLFDEVTRTSAARAVARGLVGWVAFRFTLTILGFGLDMGGLTMPVDVESRMARYASLRGGVDDRVVGYVTSLGPDDPDVYTGQLLAAYALTPMIVVWGDHRFMIADFPDDVALNAYVATRQGLVRAHPHSGLALVERSTGAP
jgi:hypothetical protein